MTMGTAIVQLQDAFCALAPIEPEEKIMCNSCEVVCIQGMNCHEIGCPNSWVDVKRECLWCGQYFLPQDKRQKCCNDDCTEAYYQ